ncbi:MAG: hypothetical protein Ct9H300mP11_32080 [Chloroflexota bacterium]|nr:MAG: hypothetical protein Ct9H300mP11_32080 [Chloroflexota bacterium]
MIFMMWSAIYFLHALLGGVINPNTIPRLKCNIVAGGANNQLLAESDGKNCTD